MNWIRFSRFFPRSQIGGMPREDSGGSGGTETDPEEQNYEKAKPCGTLRGSFPELAGRKRNGFHPES